VNPISTIDDDQHRDRAVGSIVQQNYLAERGLTN
jgi:hypothetical protein